MKKTFKIASWNVNSLRVRLQQVLDWLQQCQPDVLVLQETKVPDEKFPLQDLLATKYQVIYAGQPKYNGVAILSRQPAQEVLTELPNFADASRRVLAATIGDYRIINLYVPNGSMVGSEKFQYKLDWLAALRKFLQSQLKQYKRVIVLGDFNIAPEDRDVYDPRAWEGHVLVSEPERQALQKILQLGFVDAFRLFEQESGHYSWWDYRMRAFARDHGLRLDLILLNKALASCCVRCGIDKIPRSLPQPSDHTPVWAEFKT